MGQRLDVEGAPFIINPSDRGALELTSRLAGEHGFTAIGCGQASAASAFKEAAAFGATRLVYRSFEADGLLGAQTALTDAVVEERPDVVLAGQTALDTNDGSLAGLLGEILGGDSCGSVVDAACDPDGSLVVTLQDGSSCRFAVPVALAVGPIATRKISPLALMKATRAVVNAAPAAWSAQRATLRTLSNGISRRRTAVFDDGDAAAALTAVELLRKQRAI